MVGRFNRLLIASSRDECGDDDGGEQREVDGGRRATINAQVPSLRQHAIDDVNDAVDGLHVGPNDLRRHAFPLHDDVACRERRQ